MKPLTSSCIALMTLCLVSVLGAEDWPHWRGPDRNDISEETGLLSEWPANGPQRVWMNQNGGLGYAGFAVVGDQLFTMGLEDDSEFALCLDSLTGEEKWRVTIGPQFENKWGDGPRSTPSVDGDRVYFMSAAGHLACLNRSDGQEIWSIKMTDFGGKVPVWGYAESPLVDGDRVVCTPGGDRCTMLAVDKMTGKTIWQSDVVKGTQKGETGPVQAHYSSILPVTWNDKHQYIQLTVAAAIGVDAENGSILWQIDWPGRVAVIPSPIFNDGLAYFTSGYSIGSKLVEIDSNNKAKELWYKNDMQNHHGGVIQIGDHYYGSSAKAFVCQEQESGEMVWAERGIQKGAVTYADGHFYHIEEDSGDVLLFEADEKGHKIKGEFTLNPQTQRRKPAGKIWVHPVIANGKLYLRDQEIIYCYDIKAN